jgi:hypothetical protein
MTISRSSAPLWLACAAVMAATAAQAGEKLPKCFDAMREGDCVAVTVNGQRSVKLTKSTKKMLKELGALEWGGDTTKYEVPEPVRGDLEVDASWLPEAVPAFGAEPEVSIRVLTLEGQDLDTRPELSADSSVQIGGSAVVTRSDVIQGNRLPPGKYLFSVRLRGSNWDRQTLFVQVVE